MIKKIVKIKNVGRFVNHSAVGDIEFREINLIHGENSKGKTTLTSIFRSLTSKNNELISERKTIGSNDEQEIEILIAGYSNPTIYKDDTWNKHIEGIEIFDVNFINENVYSGLEIGPDHKKRLHSFVLGTQGVELTEEINKLKITIEKSNDSLRTLSNNIQPYIKGAFPFEDFIKLKKDNLLNNKIAEQQKILEVCKFQKQIQEQGELVEIPLLDLELDVKKVKTLLNETITTIQSQYLQKIEKHKKLLGLKNEDWLKVGLEHIKDDKCPFCTQSLEEVEEIITAYTQFFNEEYKSLKEAVMSLSGKLRSINTDSIIAQKELLVARNKEKFLFWKKYIKTSYKDDGLFIEKQKITKKIENLTSLVNDKSVDLLQQIDYNKAEELIGLVNSINTKIDNYNRLVKSYNQEIRIIKNKPRGDISQINSNLLKLQVHKFRFEKSIAKKCKKYVDQEETLIKLNVRKNKKQRQLNQLIESTFEKYESSVNEYLNKFGVDFEISKIKGGNYRGTSKEPYVDYVVKLADCELNFERDGVNPCVKNCLGEGDKAALAFAFFLSKLDVDGDLDSKIIVFDDPLSSFDENRKSATLEQLHRLSKEAKQILILTHNPLIAREFWQGLEEDGKCKTLHIVRRRNSSCIEEWDLVEETAGTYYQNYKTLEGFINDGGSTQDGMLKVAQCIRPLLERYLRVKYPGMFSPKEWLGDFIKKIREASTDLPLVSIQGRLTELEGLNEYSKRFHHDTNPNSASQTIIEAELSNYAKKALDFIYK